MLTAEFNEDTATFTVEPTHGKRVVFVVEYRKVPVGRASWGRRNTALRYVVGLAGSSGEGFTTHTSYEAACNSAHSRARRYDKAYSINRRIVAVAA